MKHCSNCHSMLEDDAAFCVYCGTKIDTNVPTGPTCPNCHAPLEDGATFCVYCGTKIEEKAAAQKALNEYVHNMNAEDERAKKERNQVLLFGLIIILVIILVGGGAYFVIQNKTNSDNTEDSIEITDSIEDETLLDEYVSTNYDDSEYFEPTDEDENDYETNNIEPNILQLEDEEDDYEDEPEGFEEPQEDAPITSSSFPGGEKAMYEWLSSHIRYPSICSEQGIQGRVYAEFDIDEQGNIFNVKILRSPDDNLSKEAVRVIQSMPKWVPARKGNKNIQSHYSLPIMFRLS